MSRLQAVVFDMDVAERGVRLPGAHAALERTSAAGLIAAVVVGLIACTPIQGCRAAVDAADVVLLNARVYTFAWPAPAPDGTTSPEAPADAQGWHPDATAVGVRDGLIAAVGSDAQLRQFIGPDTRVIDLEGATLLPGLIESHAHAAELGRNLRRVDLLGVETEEELVARAVAAAAADSASDWILGWGFDDGAWADRYGDNRLLSESIPDRPVMLSGLHGFAVWLNDEALRRAGIDAGTPEPEGGRILRRADGTPSGLLVDRARSLVEAVIEEPTEESMQADLMAGLSELARQGYVSVHEAGVGAATLQALQALDTRGELPLHVYVMLSARDAELSRQWIERGPLVAEGRGARLTVRAVKAYYDAALGSRGARLLEDYADAPGNRGTAGADYGFDEELVAELMRAGFQVGIHAIGDAGNRETLDFFAGVFERYPETRAGRHRIEHAQVLHPDDLPRLATMGITASMEPPHAVEDKAWAEDRLGPDRLRGAYAWRSLRLAGTDLIFNSDLPGSDPSFFYGLHAAVTRRDRHMQPPGGWYPEEALTAEEAIRAYTVDAARAAFVEGIGGGIIAGLRADLTALNVDPLTLPPQRYGEILAGAAVLTMVDGQVVFHQR